MSKKRSGKCGCGCSLHGSVLICVVRFAPIEAHPEAVCTHRPDAKFANLSRIPCETPTAFFRCFATKTWRQSTISTHSALWCLHMVRCLLSPPHAQSLLSYASPFDGSHNVLVMQITRECLSMAWSGPSLYVPGCCILFIYSRTVT